MNPRVRVKSPQAVESSEHDLDLTPPLHINHNQAKVNAFSGNTVKHSTRNKTMPRDSLLFSEVKSGITSGTQQRPQTTPASDIGLSSRSFLRLLALGIASLAIAGTGLLTPQNAHARKAVEGYKWNHPLFEQVYDSVEKWTRYRYTHPATKEEEKKFKRMSKKELEEAIRYDMIRLESTIAKINQASVMKLRSKRIETFHIAMWSLVYDFDTGYSWIKSSVRKLKNPGGNNPAYWFALKWAASGIERTTEYSGRINPKIRNSMDPPLPTDPKILEYIYKIKKLKYAKLEELYKPFMVSQP